MVLAPLHIGIHPRCVSVSGYVDHAEGESPVGIGALNLQSLPGEDDGWWH